MDSFIPPNRFPKLSLVYKCHDCGKKFNLISGLLSKKCPHCQGENVKLSAEMKEYKPNPLDDLICW